MTIGDKVSLLVPHPGTDANNDPTVDAGTVGTITGKNPNYENLFFVTFPQGIIAVPGEQLSPSV